MEKESKNNKKCPFCSEEVLADAQKCKHCGECLGKNEKNLSIVYKVILGIFLVIVVLIVVDDYNRTQVAMNELRRGTYR